MLFNKNNDDLYYPPMTLDRFLKAQERDYAVALTEIKNGKKLTHWIWYIFPQMKGLGSSCFSELYGIQDLQEAVEFLNHPILGLRLRDICRELLNHTGLMPEDIFGELDSIKVRSSMTLFNLVSPNDVFALVLSQFYKGDYCPLTLEIVAADYNTRHNCCINEIKIGPATYSHDRRVLLRCDEDVQEYEVPEGTLVIADGAFEDCLNLRRVSLPEGLLLIGEMAFKGCVNLGYDIVLPDSVVEIKTRSFERCLSLKRLSSSKSSCLKIIGNAAFAYCSSLRGESLLEGGNIESIGYNAFLRCDVRYLRFPASVKEIGVCAFSFCENLYIIIVSGDIEALSAHAFTGCKSLHVVVTPESMKDHITIAKLRSLISDRSELVVKQ